MDADGFNQRVHGGFIRTAFVGGGGIMNIKAARKAKGMTQKQLAEAAGVSLSYIERLEAGWMPEFKLQRVLEVLND